MARSQAAPKVEGTKVPRKADTNRERAKRRKLGKDPNKIGQSVVREWKDGSGEVRVGRTVVRLLKGTSEYPVEDWTDEELLRGAPMNVNHLPHVIPMVVYMELTRRVMSKVQHRFAAELEVAVNEHIKMIKSEFTPESTKARLIEMLYERVMGKVPEHVELHAGGMAPWQKAIADSIVSMDPSAIGSGDEEVVEGEVVDDGGGPAEEA